MNAHSEVWPTDIDQIPPTPVGSWIPRAEDQDNHVDSGVYAQRYTGIRPMKSSLQMRQLPGAYNGAVIRNQNIPLSSQRFVTMACSRSKRAVTPPTLSFHNIHYTVKRRRCNLLSTSKSYPILKGIR